MKKELILDAKLENLELALDFIGAELENLYCPADIMSQIAIAAEEIFVNIARYAYKPKVGGVVIRINAAYGGVDFESDEVGVIIDFEDSGTPFNPLQKEDPDVTLSAEEREVGGLGIFMVKELMDDVEYRYESGKNIVIIRKSIKKQ